MEINIRYTIEEYKNLQRLNLIETDIQLKCKKHTDEVATIIAEKRTKKYIHYLYYAPSFFAGDFVRKNVERLKAMQKNGFFVFYDLKQNEYKFFD